MMQMAQRETTLGGLVRAADTLGLSLHVRLREKAPPAYRCRYCRSDEKRHFFLLEWWFVWITDWQPHLIHLPT